MTQLDIVASTYKIRVKRYIGTAFILEQDSKAFLITAKHIGIHIESYIEIAWESGWEFMPVQVIGHSDEDITVMYLKDNPARRLSTKYTPPTVEPALRLGEEVRFYGFPLGMSTSRGSGAVPVPLVKAGIISGFWGTETLGDSSSFWIDGHNNPGFSGGPVVSMRDGVFAISGVISGYRNEEVDVLGLDQEIIGKVRSNSGIIKAENINGVMDIIASF